MFIVFLAGVKIPWKQGCFGFVFVHFVLCCISGTYNSAENSINTLREDMRKSVNELKLATAYGVKCIIRIWNGKYAQRDFPELINLYN